MGNVSCSVDEVLRLPDDVTLKVETNEHLFNSLLEIVLKNIDEETAEKKC